ncbi:MAG: hypothetical protein KDA80_24640 [Planctomycetaceae bacterium]|nr:hypothetical protein [Planctomycetaceae bacterium]
MKARTGVGVAAVVGLAFLLSRLFLGLGPGGGSSVGTGSPAASPSQNEDPAEVVKNVSVSTNLPSGSGTVDPADAPGSEPEMVTVVIHRDAFRLTQGPDDYQSGLDVGLDTIVKRAKSASGNDDGVRIRILLEKSAQEGARQELYTALEEAGIKSEQIQEISGFVN